MTPLSCLSRRTPRGVSHRRSKFYCAKIGHTSTSFTVHRCEDQQNTLDGGEIHGPSIDTLHEQSPTPLPSPDHTTTSSRSKNAVLQTGQHPCALSSWQIQLYMHNKQALARADEGAWPFLPPAEYVSTHSRDGRVAHVPLAGLAVIRYTPLHGICGVPLTVQQSVAWPEFCWGNR